MREYRPAKRVKLYVQDQYSCSWCGKTPDDGVKLNLDHVIPRTDPAVPKHRQNLDTNLLTSCETCNKTRQDLPIAKWIDQITNTPAERERLHAKIARKLADRADKAIMRHAKREAKAILETVYPDSKGYQLHGTGCGDWSFRTYQTWQKRHGVTQ